MHALVGTDRKRPADTRQGLVRARGQRLFDQRDAGTRAYGEVSFQIVRRPCLIGIDNQLGFRGRLTHGGDAHRIVIAAELDLQKRLVVKLPAIGQRSIRTLSVGSWLEVILISGNSPIASLPGATNYGWLEHDPKACSTPSFLLERPAQELAIVSGDPTLERIAQGNGLALLAAGSWTARFAPDLERMVRDAEKLAGSRPNIFIDVSRVSKLDTFGAWLIERLRRSLTQGNVEAKIAGLSANYSSLVDEVRRVKVTPVVETGAVTITGMLDQIGRTMAGIGGTMVGLIDMLGAVLAASGRVLIHPRGFRLTSTVHHLEQVCWRAVPIVVLITFLIGCIISQQGIFHFRKFGADIFVVDMLGVLVLREIGVLL